jgi:hypothetical protein
MGYANRTTLARCTSLKREEVDPMDEIINLIASLITISLYVKKSINKSKKG